MRTFEEQLIFDVTGVKTEMYENYSNLTVDKTELTKIIHMDYNQAIEHAANEATLIISDAEGEINYSDAYVDEEKEMVIGVYRKSILKLKK